MVNLTNTLKLRALMLEKGFTQGQLAKLLEISEQSLNYKINNKREFKASEIKTLVNLLHIPMEEVDRIFFAADVDL